MIKGCTKYSQILFNMYENDYKKWFKDEEPWVFDKCKVYIKNYFEDFDVKFNDTNIKTLMSLSECETKAIRIRYGVFDNGIHQSNRASSSESITEQQVCQSIHVFEFRVKCDLYRKLRYLITQFKKGNKVVPIEQLVGISELGINSRTINSIIRSNDAPYVLEEFENITLSELKRIKRLGIKGVNEIVEKVRDKGYKLAGNEEYLLTEDESNVCFKIELLLKDMNKIKHDIKEFGFETARLDDTIGELTRISESLDSVIELLRYSQKGDNCERCK